VRPAGSVPVLGLLRIHRHEGNAISPRPCLGRCPMRRSVRFLLEIATVAGHARAGSSPRSRSSDRRSHRSPRIGRGRSRSRSKGNAASLSLVTVRTRDPPLCADADLGLANSLDVQICELCGLGCAGLWKTSGMAAREDSSTKDSSAATASDESLSTIVGLYLLKADLRRTFMCIFGGRKSMIWLSLEGAGQEFK
jgi:hypothetical protein